MALDYYVHYLANTSRLKVWLLTTAGIGIPTVIGITAGAIVASALNNINAWKTAYTDPHQGLSFLIRDMLHPRGFANFLLILLSFSSINTNIMSLYLSAISFHQMATPYAKVPRFV
jgi:purine-cytosine permease-like protein